MKKITTTLLVLLVALSSCHTWVFNTRSCNGRIPLYTLTKTETTKAETKIDTTTPPTTKTTTTTGTTTETITTTASWSNFNELLSALYSSAKIQKGDQHLLIIKSKRKQETDIRQLICDYWK